MLEHLSYLEYAQQEWHTRLQAHYANGPPPWPRNACDRIWLVKSAQDGRTHAVTAGSHDELWQTLLDLHPIRIRYTATPPAAGCYHEVPLFFASAQQAVQAVHLLHDDFAIPLPAFQITRVPRYVQLLIQDPAWLDLDQDQVRQLVEYLHPTHFPVPAWTDEPLTPHQRRYHDHGQRELTDLAAMDRVQLAEHLRLQTYLANDAERVADWLQQQPSIQDLGKEPRFAKHVRARALHACFPCPNRDKTLTAPRIHWNGSIDLQVGVLEPATPTGANHVPPQP